MSTILIVEDEKGIREGLQAAVETLGHRALLSPGISVARELLSRSEIDCVLLDIRLRDGDGLELLRELRQGARRDVPVVMVTAYGDSERTIRAMRDGAFDYLTKPFDVPVLLSTVERAIKQRTLTQTLHSEQPKVPSPLQAGSLVGTSTAMLAIWKLIGRAAATQVPVLITGETGTGKELVARAIHDYSTSAQQPFVAVNLAAVPSSLLESELFGHEKGAFTGATVRRAGRLELAAQGTLFLDEIGDLEGALQTKLLRVLADGCFERIGGSETLQNRARVITATHKPVHPAEPGCVLREDLYYRLAVIEISVPPLRARRSDIPLLVAHALEGTPARAVSEEAMGCLMNYRWPGNVRELMHVIKRSAVLCGGEVIDVPALPIGLCTTSSTVTAKDVGRTESWQIPEDGTLKEAVQQLEKYLLLRALQRAGGNRSEAARQLGIGRPNLYAKLEEHGLTIRSDGEESEKA